MQQRECRNPRCSSFGIIRMSHEKARAPFGTCGLSRLPARAMRHIPPFPVPVRTFRASRTFSARGAQHVDSGNGLSTFPPFPAPSAPTGRARGSSALLPALTRAGPSLLHRRRARGSPNLSGTGTPLAIACFFFPCPKNLPSQLFVTACQKKMTFTPPFKTRAGVIPAA